MTKKNNTYDDEPFVMDFNELIGINTDPASKIDNAMKYGMYEPLFEALKKLENKTYSSWSKGPRAEYN